MKTIKPVLLIALLALFNACGNKSTNETANDDAANDAYESTTTDDSKDTEFAKAAADAGKLEVQLANMAMEKSSSQVVKDFAQTMITDHTNAGNELASLAASKNIMLPEALSDDSQDKVDKLTSKTGEDFDKEYADMMVKDHKKAVDDFQKEADKGDDMELKQWAQKILPTLQNHLSMAESMQDKVKQNSN